MVIKGYTYKEAAEKLSVSERTIGEHVKKIRTLIILCIYCADSCAKGTHIVLIPLSGILLLFFGNGHKHHLSTYKGNYRDKIFFTINQAAISFFVYLKKPTAAPITEMIAPMAISNVSSCASEIILLASA